MAQVHVTQRNSHWKPEQIKAVSDAFCHSAVVRAGLGTLGPNILNTHARRVSGQSSCSVANFPGQMLSPGMNLAAGRRLAIAYQNNKVGYRGGNLDHDGP